MAKIPLKLDQIVNRASLRDELEALAKSGKAATPDGRNTVLKLLKERLQSGRKRAEEMLSEDGGGTACAIRLSHLMDELIRALHEFAHKHVFSASNPSAAEHMSIVAVGGYGRGTLAPGSDIDLLFLLPYKQTPWGEQVVEYMLYMFWDMGLKVGHSTRNIDECIRQAANDMTIRTAVLEARAICGDRSLYDELVRRFDREIVKNTGAEFIQAKLSERFADIPLKAPRLSRARYCRYDEIVGPTRASAHVKNLDIARIMLDEQHSQSLRRFLHVSLDFHIAPYRTYRPLKSLPRIIV